MEVYNKYLRLLEKIGKNEISKMDRLMTSLVKQGDETFKLPEGFEEVLDTHLRIELINKLKSRISKATKKKEFIPKDNFNHIYELGRLDFQYMVRAPTLSYTEGRVSGLKYEDLEDWTRHKYYYRSLRDMLILYIEIYEKEFRICFLDHFWAVRSSNNLMMTVNREGRCISNTTQQKAIVIGKCKLTSDTPYPDPILETVRGGFRVHFVPSEFVPEHLHNTTRVSNEAELKTAGFSAEDYAHKFYLNIARNPDLESRVKHMQELVELSDKLKVRFGIEDRKTFVTTYNLKDLLRVLNFDKIAHSVSGFSAIEFRVEPAKDIVYNLSIGLIVFGYTNSTMIEVTTFLIFNMIEINGVKKLRFIPELERTYVEQIVDTEKREEIIYGIQDSSKLINQAYIDDKTSGFECLVSYRVPTIIMSDKILESELKIVPSQLIASEIDLSDLKSILETVYPTMKAQLDYQLEITSSP
ncbi:hypothetical protein [Carp edema virus]|nr:hypothetical protein [Carp edema virus]